MYLEVTREGNRPQKITIWMVIFFIPKKLRKKIVDNNKIKYIKIKNKLH